MHTTFVFDGNALTLHLKVDGPEERAVADLMSSFTEASVSIVREHDRYGYTNYDERKVQGVNIVLVRPMPKAEPEPASNAIV